MSKVHREHTISQRISLENRHKTHKYGVHECQDKIELYCICVYVCMCICDWLWENLPVTHKDNYLEKRN